MLFLEQFLERPILRALVELATERDRIACLGGLEEGDWLGKQRCGVLRVSMGADIELHASVYHFCGGCAAKRRLRTAILCACVHACEGRFAHLFFLVLVCKLSRSPLLRSDADSRLLCRRGKLVLSL